MNSSRTTRTAAFVAVLADGEVCWPTVASNPGRVTSAARKILPDKEWTVGQVHLYRVRPDDSGILPRLPMGRTLIYALSQGGQVKKSAYLAASVDQLKARWSRNRPTDVPLEMVLSQKQAELVYYHAKVFLEKNDGDQQTQTQPIQDSSGGQEDSSATLREHPDE